MAETVHSDAQTDAAGRRKPGVMPRFRSYVRSTASLVLDSLFPPLCLGCETRIASHDALCAECWARIDFIRPPLCDRFGIPFNHDVSTEGPIISAAAAANPPVYRRARAVALYDGLMRDLIHKLKFGDRHDARQLFARWMHQAGRELLEETDIIVPVPLARWRLVTRRFNQAEILARNVGRLASLPVDAFALRRRHTRAHQVDLTRAERFKNVSGIFSMTPDAAGRIAGRRVLLIDDVVTTGATVSSAAKMLLSAGAQDVSILVLALTDESRGRR